MLGVRIPPRVPNMNIAKAVLDMQIENKKLKKRIEDVVEFLRGIDTNDVRSASFVANRILVRLEEPTNEALRIMDNKCSKCGGSGWLRTRDMDSKQEAYKKIDCYKCNKS